MQLRHTPRPLSLARPRIRAKWIYVTDSSYVTAVRTNVIAHVQGINALTGRRLVRGADQNLVRRHGSRPG